jgi:hypothetical protein
VVIDAHHAELAEAVGTKPRWWTVRSPRGSRVGNFDEQVWGELRERGHNLGGAERIVPGGN